jgi:tetratricopeptide (TPR) repeat protein
LIALFGLLWTAAAGDFDAVDAATTPAAKVEALVPLLEGDTAAEAWQRLGQAFVLSGKLPLATLAYAEALALDPELEGVGAAVAIADEVGDVGPLAVAMAQREAALGTGDQASANAVLVARELLRDGQLTRAQEWLGRVSADSPAFADAESLRGVVLAAKGQNSDALAPLQTARAMGKTLDKGRRFDDKLVMNIARAYYGDKNYGQAIYHYSLVPRDSIYWPDARFEKAWAHFRAGDVPGAIGELQTHQSPFFDALWFPEAWMLRTQSLFVMCRYGAAIEAMDAYEARFTPVLEDLDRGLTALDEAAAFADVTTYLEGGDPKLPELVLRAYRGEDRIASRRKAVARYREAATQTGDLGAAADRFAALATERADAIEREEGARILARVERNKSELADMISGLELARIDILDRESRMFERAAATGSLETPDRKAELKRISREKKGFRVWPFEGEYWLDELGWYQVNALSLCPPEK